MKKWKKVKKHEDKSKYKSSRYVNSSSDASPHRSRGKSTKSSPKQGNNTSDREQEKSRQPASTIIIVYRDIRQLDKERRSHEVRRELPPDLIYFREVDLSDLPSQYTEDIETFRQVLGISDPKHSMPVSSSVMALNEEQQQEAN